MDVKMTFFGRSRSGSGRWVVCRDSTRGLRRVRSEGRSGQEVRDGSELREDRRR